MDKEKNELIESAEVSEESAASTQKSEKNGSKNKNNRTKKAIAAEKKDSAENISESAPTNKESKNEKNENESVAEELIADTTFDSLIVDEDAVIISEDKEEVSGFDEFLSDYKKIIGKTLSSAKSAFSKDSKVEDTEDGETDNVIISEEGEHGQFTMDISEPETVNDSEEEDSEDEKEVYNPDKPRIIDTVFDFLELFVFTLAAVLIITGFFFKHTIVVGGSMDKTLENGEHLIISDLFYTPKRGDVIVFQDSSTGLDYPLVKRVIGVAGDTVTVDELGRVSINGEPILEEDYAYFDPSINYTKGKITAVVPEGEVFVLGDNRYNSQDSRSFPNKTVKVDCILGKVLLRVFPFDSFGTVNQ